MAGVAFTLVASPIIHLSGMDKADAGPTPEEIWKSQKFAAELKEKYGNKDAI